MKNGCSLIISTYNWPEALRLCLQSVMSQKEFPNEVIIADDGSTEHTALIIAEFKNKLPIPVKHIWQPDEGFQLARIRNKAIVACSFEYIIQIDGDLILHSNFIQDHTNHAKENFFVTGSRVLLMNKITDKLLSDGYYSYSDLFNRYNTNFLNSLRIRPLRLLMLRTYKVHGKNKYYVKGCNMAFWKKDLLRVNGYNESFKGWGKEDTEIAIRLINAGIKKMFIKMGGTCYHLHHKEVSRDLEAHNIELTKNIIDKKITWSPSGLDQYFSKKIQNS